MRILLLTLFCIFLGATALAQDKTVTGHVYAGSQDSTLPGATITIKGTRRSTVTDGEGAFQLKVPAGNPVLLVEYLGYSRQEVAIGSQSVVNVSLTASPSTLNEVVVTGYGQQSRRTLTSAITTVSAKDIANIPAASSNQLIQGRAAGVLVNNNSGTPGGGVFVRIRGTSSINASSDPLYVVDGIPIQSNNLSSLGLGGGVTSPIADINPADIESMEILKDASATAIYGARAANGVVLITTKKGSNRKAKISMGSYYATQTATRKPDVVDGVTFQRLQNEAARNNGTALPYSNPDSARNTDWNSYVFRNAPMHNVDLSVSGGSDKVKYLVSGNNFKQDGILKASDFERNSFRSNLDFNITNKVRAGSSILYSRTTRTRQRSDDNISGGLEGAYFFPHNLPLMQPDGTFTKFGTFENPVAALEHTHISMLTNRFLGTAYAEWDIIKGFKLRSNFSWDYSNVGERVYDDTYTNAGGSVNGSAQSISLNNSNWIQENVLTYTNQFGDHSINALIGTSSQESRTFSTTATGQQFPSNDFTTISSAAVQTASTTGSSYGIASLFGRLVYDYKRKYLLTVNVRRDGSSRFGAAHQWGTFPSAAVGWVLTEEKFMEDMPVVSDLKLRASYGLTGNQSGINDFQASGLWQGSPYASVPGINPFQLANPNLKWETTKQTDIGIDLGLFNHRVNITADYYYKKTVDLLLAVPVPRSTGFENLVQNYGSLYNKGIELSISSDILKSPSGFNWNLAFNIAANKNKILKLAAPFFVYNRDIYQYKEGAEMFSFYLHEQTGVDPKTGAAQFKDVNGDGVFDPNVDRKIVGTANPKFYGGITNTFNFKNFDFMFFFQGSYGNKQLNWNRFFLEHGGTRASNYSTSQLARWQKEGDITMIPKMNAANYASNLRPSRFLEDGSYLRLKNISLGYSLPSSLISKVRISTARVYISAQNLITITKYTGLDPELTGTASTTLTQGIEFFTMPSPRVIMGGVNLSF